MKRGVGLGRNGGTGFSQVRGIQGRRRALWLDRAHTALRELSQRDEGQEDLE